MLVPEREPEPVWEPGPVWEPVPVPVRELGLARARAEPGQVPVPVGSEQARGPAGTAAPDWQWWARVQTQVPA